MGTSGRTHLICDSYLDLDPLGRNFALAVSQNLTQQKDLLGSLTQILGINSIIPSVSAHGLGYFQRGVDASSA